MSRMSRLCHAQVVVTTFKRWNHFIINVPSLWVSILGTDTFTNGKDKCVTFFLLVREVTFSTDDYFLLIKRIYIYIHWYSAYILYVLCFRAPSANNYLRVYMLRQIWKSAIFPDFYKKISIWKYLICSL